MKVLKDNYSDKLDMCKTNTRIKPYPRKLVCENCESELEYEKEDLEVGVYGAMHLLCPLCGYNNMLDGNENDVTLTKDNVEFPRHFYYTSVESGAVECCDNEHIRKEVNRGIEYFRQNKDEWHWYTCYGDMFISINRFDGDNEYDVFVTDRRWETYIPFEKEDY